MQIEVSRRTALRYGLIGTMAAALSACGAGGGSTSAREQALRKWAVGTWDVELVLHGRNGGSGDTDTGTITVNDDGTWESTMSHMYLKYGGNWSTEGGTMNLTSRTRNDGTNFRTREFTLSGVPEEVGDGTTASPRLAQYADTIVRTARVEGNTLTLEADYQTRGRSPRQLSATATRQ